jgi:hypothetical protein
MRRLIALLMICALAVALLPSLASAYTLSAQTNQGIYAPGETVVLTGTVVGGPGVAVSLSYLDPGGVLKGVGQVTADSSGNFSSSFTLPTNAVSGAWTAGVAAAGQTRSVQFTVSASGGGGGGGGGVFLPVVPVSAVTVSPAKLTIAVGGPPGTLTATITPSNASDQSLVWTSSDITVASVAGGVVTAHNGGEATITVTASGGHSAAAVVAVLSSDVEAPAGATYEQIARHDVAWALVGATLPATAALNSIEGLPKVQVTLPRGAAPTTVLGPANVQIVLAQVAQSSIMDSKTGRVIAVNPGMIAVGGMYFEIAIYRTDTGDRVTELAEPMQVTFHVPAGTGQGAATPSFEELVVSRYSPSLGSWEPLPTTRDLIGRTLKVRIAGTSLFAIAARGDLPVLNDITGHRDEEHVLKLVGMGVINGFGDGTFRPDLTVTREQFAKMLLLAAGIPVDSGAPFPFMDIAETGEWARPYVATAVKHELIKGIGDNRFGPTGLVTRAQALTMIARALGIAEADTGATPFQDDSDIPEWARTATVCAVRFGITSTGDFTKLLPNQASTRAENARFLARFVCARLKK